MENDEWKYWGLDIYTATKNMVNVFNENGERIETTFNGVTIVVDEDNNIPEELVTNYLIELRRQADDYRESDEYKQTKIEEEKQVKEWQADADMLMEKLDKLDFTNKGEVLDWLASIQDYTDDRRVNVNVSKIIDAFMKVGFRPFAGIDDEKKRAEIYNIKGGHAMMIIGQSLDMLIKHGSMHHVVVSWVKTWNEMFEYDNNE